MAGAQLLLLLLLCFHFWKNCCLPSLWETFGAGGKRTEERERRRIYIYYKKIPHSLPHPQEADFISHTLPCFPLACLVFFGRIFFPDRVWQSSLRLEGEREREREREREWEGGVLWDLSGAVFMDHFKDLCGGFGTEFGLKCRSGSLWLLKEVGGR